MTQPVYELGAWERFLKRLGGSPGIPILVGILPLQSFRHAEFLHNEVPGIQVPEWVRERMHEAGNEGQRAGKLFVPVNCGASMIPSNSPRRSVKSITRS